MPGGRPRKSIADHKMNGNPSKLNLDEMEKKIIKLPFDKKSFKPPSHISKNPEAKKVWRETVISLQSKDVLAGIDKPVLGAYCMAHANFVRYTEYLNKRKKLHNKTKTGYMQLDPYISLARQASQDIKSLGDILFCTPVSRQRGLGPGSSGDDPTSGEPVDEMDEILYQARQRVEDKKDLKAIKDTKPVKEKKK